MTQIQTEAEQLYPNTDSQLTEYVNKLLRKAYERGANRNAWISVDVELPPVFTRVLVTDGKEVHEAHRNTRTGEWCGWHTLGDEYLDTITAWQPLPQPPQ
jgi:hypothetical protein